MSYRSPLEGSYGAELSSYTSRYSPYGHCDRASNRGYQRECDHRSHAREPEPSTSRHGRVKYSDRYKKSSVYPRELTDLFGSLDCKLCGVEVFSPIVAKMHYSGKQHMKKVKNFLTEWCFRTNMPMPQLEEPSHFSSSSTLPDFCDICDVRFTSVNDKLLHFSGKNHKKNEQDPANAKRKKKAYETIDISGVRFGIGNDFALDSSDQLATRMIPATIMESQEFKCDLCDVRAVSQEQLQAHLTGKRHREKLEKKDSIVPKTDKRFRCEICEVSLETPTLWQMHLDGKKHAKNLLKMEINNTGTDFCDICDLSFTSFDQYQMHMQGKKHEKKCRSMYSTAINTPDEKVLVACESCPFVGNLEQHVCDQSLKNVNFDDLENKWVCFACHNMMFESEAELNEHKSSRRHLLCVLNQESGDKIIEELKHWYCFICKKQYRHHKDYTEHLFEQRHMSLSSEESNLDSKTDLFQCTVCNVVLDKVAKDEHMKDRKHLKQALKKDTINTLTTLAHEEIKTTSFHCSNCDMTLNSYVKYSDHLLSDAHMDRMISAKLEQLR